MKIAYLKKNWFALVGALIILIITIICGISLLGFMGFMIVWLLTYSFFWRDNLKKN